MGTEAILAAIIGLATAVGGFMGGRRSGRSQALTDDVNSVGLLKAAIDELSRQAGVKDVLIAELTGRVATLEGLVTQRADVKAVELEVKGVRETVNRIAEAVC